MEHDDLGKTDQVSSSDESAHDHTALGWGGEIGGLILLALSIVFMIGGWQLGLGVPTRLGTGAFPFISGAILAVLAIVICIQERHGDGIAETPDWVAFSAICAALAIFALSAEVLGLIPAAFAAVFTASLPDRTLSILGKVILGTVVSLGCWAIFIEVLNLPFKPFAGF
ncbi:tripartite tricarboxylate transporter TctB family protein [uncultured Ruegeria sp.]|uniref:tripartite tricarboxylate transporter TctB family protein n=1 Tax=uncultured Ruegeria sp. TaxID=259304 RepID=UPI002623B521|nr:tripartite tricarboxylate transporter TctB family protein [uncultured Ruegeria sp.]